MQTCGGTLVKPRMKQSVEEMPPAILSLMLLEAKTQDNLLFINIVDCQCPLVYYPQIHPQKYHQSDLLTGKFVHLTCLNFLIDATVDKGSTSNSLNPLASSPSEVGPRLMFIA